MAQSTKPAQVIAKLEEKIAELAELTTKGSYTHAEKYASAARQLAEARAWLISASQPHGTNATGGE